MSFLGPVTRSATSSSARTTSRSCGAPLNGSTREAIVTRVARLGFEVRVELTLDDDGVGWTCPPGRRYGRSVNQREGAVSPTVSDSELKARHRAMWASGDYPSMVETFLLPLGPRLVEACGIGPGMSVLDVAAGTGNASIPAAQAGATSRPAT